MVAGFNLIPFVGTKFIHLPFQFFDFIQIWNSEVEIWIRNDLRRDVIYIVVCEM